MDPATPHAHPEPVAPERVGATLLATIGRMAISVAVPLVAFVILWQGFLFLRDTDAPKGVVVAVAILWGVGGVAGLYLLGNWLIGQLPEHFGSRILPFLFVGPALAILAWYLLLPVARTLVLSFQNRDSTEFVGLANYVTAFTDPAFLEAIRNNLLWLVIGTLFTTGFGLLVAILAEHSILGRLAKILIFMPLAISFVGAGIIWGQVYAAFPPNREQVGLLNGIVTAFSGDPVIWLQNEPWNTLFLIVILIWGQAGFAMVILSAALRGVPDELREAARIDGASETQVYTRIVIPSIRPTIITVATTIAILTLKVFDIIKATTNGNFGTQVIATLQFDEAFRAFDYGTGAALAIILLVAVSPVVWYNLRLFRSREGMR